MSDKKQEKEFEVPVDSGAEEESGSERDSGACAPSGEPEEGREESVDVKYLRLLADFENYRRRMRQRELEAAREAEARLMAKLLPIVDDVERLLDHLDHRDDAVAEGARLIYQKLLDLLRAEGLEPVETDDGRFDPEVHHAVQAVEVDDPDLDGKVLKVAKKGYRYKGKLLRPAEVVVGRYRKEDED